MRAFRETAKIKRESVLIQADDGDGGDGGNDGDNGNDDINISDGEEESVGGSLYLLGQLYTRLCTKNL